MSQKMPIAIIGIGCRFPGGVHGSDAFWKLLRGGVDAVTEVPTDRWNVEAYFDPAPNRKGKTVACWGGFLDSITQFDAGFFGISPREAAFLDPQQRLLLHAAWEALEDGGQVVDPRRGSPTGVFVGISTNDYSQLQSSLTNLNTIEAYTATGSAASIAANRVSYCLNLNGPSLAVDTACSSSLVAVHLACTSLLNGECPLALAGGVNVIIGVTPFISFSRSAMLSPDGRCKAFDAGANGFVRAEGVGVVALKPLAAALADGNPIYAVIRGTAMNQDGRTNGITVPSAAAQEALVREACRKAGVPPAKVQYVEAHGTGTFVGDPIEAQALGAALGPERSSKTSCVIGSVKTNIGHLEAGAGIAGLIKTALSLKYGQIPPSLHFRNPNPHIDFEKLKLRVAQSIEPYRNGSEPIIAGVNSFGFGGTNAHIILQSLPGSKRPRHPTRKPRADCIYLLPLSARCEESLRGLVEKYKTFLSPGGAGHSLGLDETCLTAGAHRTHHPHRLCFTTGSRKEMIENLEAFLAGESRPGMSSGQTADEQSPVFVFSGQGPQWWAMGRELLNEEPLFRQMIEECDSLFREFGEWSLIEELTRDVSSSRMHETAIAQPAIFALQVALAALWQSWGIRPGAAVGHSVGEVAAAHLAGVLSLREAARVIFQRGRCMELAPNHGRMLAAGLSWAQAEEAISAYTGRVSIAALNSPNSATLSGDADALEAIAAALEQRAIFCRFLQVNYAFHSRQMEPVCDELLRSLGRVEVHPASMCLFSTVTGAEAAANDFGTDYWWRNVRLPVRFATAVDALIERGHRIFLELSPHPTLTSSVMECLAHRSATGAAVPSLRRKEKERATMLGSLGALHVLGCQVNWKALYPGVATIRLPAYAWQQEPYWHEAEECREARLNPTAHPFLTQNIKAADPIWQTRIDTEAMPYLKDHLVQGHVVFPAAGYVETALGAARVLFGLTPSVVEDIDFQKALFLPENEETLRVQFSHHLQDSSFAISSCVGGSGQLWTVNSIGKIRACPDTPPDVTSPDEVRKTCSREISGEATYQQFREIGLPFGPSFRNVETAWRSDGEAIGRIRLPSQLETESRKYQIHPALLDACFQVLLLAMPVRSAAERRTLFLPVRIERLRFFARPGSVVWSHARLSRQGDRAIVGDIRILDEAGHVLIDIRGFRCQAVTRAHSGLSEDASDWLYEFCWRLRPLPKLAVKSTPGDFLTPMSPLAVRVQSLAKRLRPLASSGGSAAQLEARIDALCRFYILDAFRQMGWQLRKGRSATLESLLRRLRVAPRHRQVFERYLSFLQKDGVLSRSGNGWKVRRAVNIPDTDSVWRSILDRFPVELSELALIRRCGRELASVLQGRTDPLQLIFPDESLDGAEHFYQDSESFRSSNLLVADAVAAALEQMPEGRTVRILEIGAGTGGMTAHVLPRLPKDRTDYVFSDLSNLFFSKAEQKFFDYPFVRYQLLDIEKSPQDQGFQPHSFDVILASDAIHTTADLRQTLANIRSLLAPEGLLVLLEADRPMRWVDLVFALTDGWWRFSDADLRPSYPLLDRRRWLDLFGEMGFTDARAFSARSEKDKSGQSVFLARGPKASSRDEAAIPLDLQKNGTPGTWLLFADRTGVAEEILSLLAARGDHPVIVSASGDYRRVDATRFEVRAEVRDDTLQLVAEVRNSGLPAIAGVIHFWSLDAAPPSRLTPQSLLTAQAETCYSVLHLVQALTQEFASELPRLWLITRGGQAVEGGDPVSVAQGPVWGLGRVITNEYPKFHCRMVDLPPNRRENETRILFNELFAEDGEEEIALRGTARYANRLISTSLEQHVREKKISDGRAGYRLEITAPGTLDHLILRACHRRKPAPGEIEIEVKAAALNFRDVMKALGIYPGENDGDALLGDECAGRITAVGRGVKGLRVGEEVIAIGPGCFSSHLTIPATLVVRKPSRLRFDEAATMPVAFLTAWYALHHLGRMRKGERVLIQAATGGVGLAALQIARLTGAEIFATAGNPEKREFLRAQGVRHVMDSRSLAFADEMREITDGRGADLVLNSLAGEAIAKGISTLAPHGRFLEIGKRDIYQNSKLDLHPFRNNISMFVIDLAQVMRDNPPLIASMLRRIMSLFEARKLHPLPFRIFQVSQAVSAFRHMSQARHIGKIVLSMENDHVHPVPAPTKKPARFKSNASYLITGGLGGFGLALAEWLLKNGAGHVVLASRGGLSTETERRAVESLRKLGSVIVTKTDVASKRDMEQLFSRIARQLPPLRGIIHAAMVMDDGIIAQQTAERFSRVMAPKAAGAWNLHTCSANLPLDFFVLFSSFAAMLGTPGQSSYVAANCFLEVLAHHRRARGLPALAINWGLISEVGFVARNAKLEEFLHHQGLVGIAPAQATHILGRLLQSDAVQVSVLRADWQKWAGCLPAMAASPRYAEVVQPSSSDQPEDGKAFRETILSLPAAERLATVTAQLKKQIARVLRTSPSKLDLERPLNEHGLDSLMSVELLNRIEAGFGVSLPPGKLAAGSSISKMALALLEILTGARSEPVVETTKAATARPSSDCLVTLRAGSARPPLFCIHPAGGLVNVYENLAKRLPSGFPVQGIQSRALCSDAGEHDSVAAMAGHYANLIANKQPRGPVHLLGFSLGGFFAMSTAHALEASGRQLAFVGLIDSDLRLTDPAYQKNDFLKPHIVEMYGTFARELSLLKPLNASALDKVAARLSSEVRAASAETRVAVVMRWLTKHGYILPGLPESLLTQYLSLFYTHGDLVGNFAPEIINTPLTLWSTGGSPGEKSGWRDYSTETVTEKIIPGAHYDLMYPPLVDTLAGQLTAALGKIGSTSGTREHALAMAKKIRLYEASLD